jgi:hypothetical protein
LLVEGAGAAGHANAELGGSVRSSPAVSRPPSSPMGHAGNRRSARESTPELSPPHGAGQERPLKCARNKGLIAVSALGWSRGRPAARRASDASAEASACTNYRQSPCRSSRTSRRPRGRTARARPVLGADYRNRPGPSAPPGYRLPPAMREMQWLGLSAASRSRCMDRDSAGRTPAASAVRRKQQRGCACRRPRVSVRSYGTRDRDLRRQPEPDGVVADGSGRGSVSQQRGAASVAGRARRNGPFRGAKSSYEPICSM